MTFEEVINALEIVKQEYIDDVARHHEYGITARATGGYYRVGNIAIKIGAITELKGKT